MIRKILIGIFQRYWTRQIKLDSYMYKLFFVLQEKKEGKKKSKDAKKTTRNKNACGVFNAVAYTGKWLHGDKRLVLYLGEYVGLTDQDIDNHPEEDKWYCEPQCRTYMDDVRISHIEEL